MVRMYIYITMFYRSNLFTFAHEHISAVKNSEGIDKFIDSIDISEAQLANNEVKT